MHSKHHTKRVKRVDKVTSIYCVLLILLDFSLTVKAATLIFISGCVSAISSALGREIRFNYNLVKSE